MVVAEMAGMVMVVVVEAEAAVDAVMPLRGEKATGLVPAVAGSAMVAAGSAVVGLATAGEATATGSTAVGTTAAGGVLAKGPGSAEGGRRQCCRCPAGPHLHQPTREGSSGLKQQSKFVA